MSTAPQVGILGIGTYLPPVVRRNDWWPAERVAEWRARRRVAERVATPMPAGAELLLAAAAAHADDPFEGARERRVMPDDMLPSAMEAAAARDALARAGVAAADVYFLLVNSTTPDYLMAGDGCRLQVDLGLGPAPLFTMQTAAAQNAFLQQVALADAMIGSGRFRCGLVVQSSAMSRHVRPEDPYSPWFGDAATAAVVGRVTASHGVLAHAHATDGSVHGGLVMGVPGQRWYDEGRVVVYIEDREKVNAMFLSMVDAVTRLVDDVLARAGVQRGDIDFFAAHQGAAWIGAAVQQHLGIPRARRVDTFPWAASVAGSNLPLVLATGERAGDLRPGDLVLAFSGAVGQTIGAMLLRWGQ
jgi:3-oxoacyl-[acyl-carrier-protein] synthase-3